MAAKRAETEIEFSRRILSLLTSNGVLCACFVRAGAANQFFVCSFDVRDGFCAVC